MDSEARLEKIFKQLELFRFTVERGHCCRNWLWQFWSSVNKVLEICRINVVWQLLKGQQNLVGFNRRRGVFTAELLLTGRAVLLLLSWRRTKGAVSDFYVNSCHSLANENLNCSWCHNVVAIFWARVSCQLVVEIACFRVKFTLGVVLIPSLACTKYVPGRLRSGSGVSLN